MSATKETALVVAATAVTATCMFVAATTAWFYTSKPSKWNELTKWKSKSEELRCKLLSYCSKPNVTIVLQNLKVPIALLELNTPKENTYDIASADEEGLVTLAGIWIHQGKIQHVEYRMGSTAKKPASASNDNARIVEVDCQGAIVMTCFVDAHTHLMKTQTVPRNRNYSGTINEALDAEASDRPRWSDNDSYHNDIYRRMEFAVQTAIHHGSKAIRTHLDGCGEDEDPNLKMTAYKAFDDIQRTYQDTILIQGVANLFLPLWLDQDLASRHAKEASQHNHVVLGAYVGRTPGIDPHDDTIQAMEALFAYAHKYQMDVDLHIDETNRPNSLALSSLCVALAKARKQLGYTGNVVLGHCCGLSLQDSQTQQQICRLLAHMENVHVVANPFTNLGLQDRSGSKPPYCQEIPIHVPRTPQWRGITLLQELRDNEVSLSTASDNVRDHWYPYGDYDMLDVWKQALSLGHLDTAPAEGSWADLITVAPAKAMGIDDQYSGLIEVNAPADLIVFPSARHCSELLARPQTDRIVLRRGQVQTTTLPDFSLLDDLVAVKTERNQQRQAVGLGAF